MKKQLIEASSNSLYTLEADFERSTKSVMQEQETEMLEKQLIQTALKESKETASVAKTTRKKPLPSLETVLKMTNMGYTLEEVIEAYRPNEAGISGMIDRILEARERQLI